MADETDSSTITTVRGQFTVGDWQQTGKTAGALLMLALLVFLSAASASCDLHALVCSDARQPTDHCAIAKYAAGMVEIPALPILCSASGFPDFVLPTGVNEALPVTPLFRLSPSRAPPFAFQVRWL